MSRRRLLLAALLGGPAAWGAWDSLAAAPAPPRLPAAPPAPLPGWAREEWPLFRDRFIRDGRVVDTGNQDISHSEGQGWGLLLAERCGDAACFRALLDWTRRHLARGDGLHAWRHRPGRPRDADDANNATDGDLFIAWALLRAERRWPGEGHAAQAGRIAAAVLERLVQHEAGRLLLLPASSGFVHGDRVVVNPSYYVWPAIRALAAARPDPRWARLEADGLALLRMARFGSHGLVPDWLAVPRGAGRLHPATGWPPRFGYDAVRLPLWLAWAGLEQEPAHRAAAALWRDRPALPAWVDLGTGRQSPYAGSQGVAAVAALARAPDQPPLFPSIRGERDYYAAALTLLARSAWDERRAA